MKSIPKSFAGFLSAVSGALLVVGVFHLTLWGMESAPNITVSTTPINRESRNGTSYAPIVKKAAPSVVNISTSHTVTARAGRNQFRQYYGNQSPTRKEEDLGSGVIISPDGYILTANHVVEGADEVKVAIDGGKKEYIAKVIGTDPPTDIAVLKIDAKGLPAITLADSDQLEVGDVVLAIGNPFNVGQTVTMGIVSALGRSGFDFNGLEGGYENFIQTDAAINPGNSGGALVDAQGRLIGINTAIISPSGGNNGIGFAVPITMARYVMEGLISGQKVTRGYLGIRLQDITPGLAQEFNLPNQKGALIADVLPGTPADKVGIKSGDVIIEFGGKEVIDSNSVRLFSSQSAPGTKVVVKLIRNGKENSFTATIGELPGQSAAVRPAVTNNPAAIAVKTSALNGVTLADLDQNTRRQLMIPASVQGAIVAQVNAGSNSDTDLQRTDVILEINRQPVGDADTAIKLCKQAKGDQTLLKIWRRGGDTGSTRFVSVDNTK
jgi:serine protease Do